MMDIHTLKVVLEQIDIVIDKNTINALCANDRLILHGMIAIRNIIREDLERAKNGEI